MLQSIRDTTHGWIAGIIISLLILSFALWGIHSYIATGGNTDVVAKVNGAEINKNQLAVAYERMRRQMQLQLGTMQLPVKVEANLKNRALQTLINTQILEKASFDADYRVSENQTEAFLQSIPEFQEKGQFSFARFQQILTATSFSIPDFMNTIRMTLLIDQPRLGISLTSFALPNEVSNTMALIGQERKLHYLLIPQSYFNNQTINVSNADVQAYYAQHQNEFKTLEQVSIDYLTLSTKDLAAKIVPSDDQLKAFYNEDPASYAQSDHKKSEMPTFSTVKDKVKQAYVQQKAQEEFANLREKMSNLTYEHPESLKPAAEALKLPVSSTGLFTKEQGGKDLSANDKVREAAFSSDVLNSQNNSDVIQLTPDSIVVVRIRKHIDAAVQPLSIVEKHIADKLRTIEVDKRATQTVTDVISKLKSGALTAAQVSAQYHIAWVDTGFVSRHASKINQAILNKAFEMPKPTNNQFVYASAKMNNAIAIVALSAIKPGNTTASREQDQAFTDQIQNTQGALEYELYKNNLIQKAKVVIEN